MKSAMRRVLLIQPPERPADEIMAKSVASYKEIPYGILSIASYLKARSKRGVDVRILDLNVVDDPDFKKIIRRKMEEFKPEIVGVSGLFSAMFNYVNEFSACVKKMDPEVLLVTGGNIATNCYELLFAHNPFIDAACYAEGELPMLALVEADAPLDVLETSPSWITRKKIEEGRKPEPTYIQDLDEIPPIDFSLAELERYDYRCRNNNPISHDEEHPVRLPFITTRGCPFSCVFCAAGSLSGKKVRYMSAERVIADIRKARDEYKMTRLVINDDQALLDRDRIKKILAGIEEMGLIVEFPSGLNVRFIDEEIALGLKKAGLDVANLAIESGSPRVLKEIIGKPLKLEDIRPVVEILRKSGLLVHGFFIFGFPGEEEEDRKATVDLIKDVGIDWSNIYAAAPLRGSRLHKICVEKGYIADDDDLLRSNVFKSTIRTSDMDPEAMTKYVYRVNLDVNFVHNYRMKIRDYSSAKGYFSNIVQNHPTHAFAHYCLARAHEGLKSERAIVDAHMESFRRIVASDGEWAEYAKEFGLM